MVDSDESFVPLSGDLSELQENKNVKNSIKMAAIILFMMMYLLYFQSLYVDV